MAIIQCRECGKDVSNGFSVVKCPHCGASTPDEKKYKRAKNGFKAFGAFLGGLFLFIVIALIFVEEDPEAKAKRLAECRKDLKCWAKENRIDMLLACDPIIESNAKYEFKWGDDWDNYPYLTWTDKDKGIITYKGDNISFQNGFGVFQQINYGCVCDTANKTLLDVIIEPIE